MSATTKKPISTGTASRLARFRKVYHRPPNRSVDCQCCSGVIAPFESLQLAAAQAREGCGRNQTLRQKWENLKNLANLGQIVGVSSARFTFSRPTFVVPADCLEKAVDE